LGEHEHDQHVDHHDPRGRPRVDADDQQHRRHDLADEYQVGQRARQAVRRQHPRDEAHPRMELEDAVQQDEDPQGESKDEFAGVV
jgi:hypothetical protein